MKTEKRKFYSSNKWRKLRQYVFDRDAGLCAECKRNGRTTEADVIHHIKPWAKTASAEEREKLKWDKDNLEPVCHKCHGLLHKQLFRDTREASEIYQMALELLAPKKE